MVQSAIRQEIFLGRLFFTMPGMNLAHGELRGPSMVCAAPVDEGLGRFRQLFLVFWIIFFLRNGILDNCFRKEPKAN
jgi:hypothetical protein